MHTYINQLSNYVDQSVELKGWVSNIRVSKTNIFIVLRDGSGYTQAVVSDDQLSEADFETSKRHRHHS